MPEWLGVALVKGCKIFRTVAGLPLSNSRCVVRVAMERDAGVNSRMVVMMCFSGQGAGEVRSTMQRSCIIIFL